MIGILLLFNLLFITYFFFIKTPFLSIFPILFSIFIFAIGINEGGSGFSLKDIKKILINNILSLSWILIQIGIFFFLKYYNIDGINILLGGITLNTLLLIISFATNFKDGKKVFHIGYYFTQLLTILYIAYNLGIWDFLNNLLNIIAYFISLNFALYVFIYFIVSLFQKINKIVSYLIFTYGLILSILAIYFIANFNSHFAVFIGQVWIFFLLALIYFAKLEYEKQLQPQYKNLTNQQLIEKILKGEKILQQKQQYNFIKSFSINLYKYFLQQPSFNKALLSISNIILILRQIIIFFQNIQANDNILSYQILYRTAIIIFFTNFLIIKQLNLYYHIQRVFLFFILNFSIYLSLLHIFTQNIKLLVSAAIIWNIANSLAILFIKNTSIGKILTYADYQIWILTNILAGFVNLAFIFQLNLDYHLKFSIATIYIGLVFFLNIYIFKKFEEGKI